MYVISDSSIALLDNILRYQIFNGVSINVGHLAWIKDIVRRRACCTLAVNYEVFCKRFTAPRIIFL